MRMRVCVCVGAGVGVSVRACMWTIIDTEGHYRHTCTIRQKGASLAGDEGMGMGMGMHKTCFGRLAAN